MHVYQPLRAFAFFILLACLSPAFGQDYDSDNDGIADSLECEPPPHLVTVNGYDIFSLRATYHTAVIRTRDGFAITGDEANANATDASLFKEIKPANGYNYTGTPLLVEVSSDGSNTNAKHVLLTSDSLYAWGGATTIPTATGSSFEAIDLPVGVAATDIKDIRMSHQFATMLLTKNGHVYILPSTTTIGNLIGANNGGADANGWYHVLRSSGGAALSGIKAVAISNEIAMVLDSSGSMYTWGKNVYLANGGGTNVYNYPTQMASVSASFDPIHIGVLYTGNAFVLGSDGILYGVGDGKSGVLGQGSTSNQKNWVPVKDSTGTDTLRAVKFFTTTATQTRVPSIAAVVGDGLMYSWGVDNNSSIAVGGGNVLLPKVPKGINVDSTRVRTFSTGGHITPMIKKDSNSYCNVGHNYTGAFGDGSSLDRSRYECYEIAVPMICDYDYDDDGILNIYDLDSDGDGCPDAIEGSWAVPYDQIQGDTISGSVDGNGIPTYVDGGQGLGYSQDSSVRACPSMTTSVDKLVIFEDSSYTGNVLLNDQDYGDSIHVALVNGSTVSTGTTISTSYGQLTIDSNGLYSYTPNTGFTGQDSFSITICTNNPYITPDVCRTELLLIDVVPLENPADTSTDQVVACPDELHTYGDTVQISLLANDRDPQWEGLQFQGLVSPTGGAQISSGTLSTVPGTTYSGSAVADAGDVLIAADGTFTFIPAPGFSGTVELQYEVCDSLSPIRCTYEIVRIEVLDTNAIDSMDLAPLAGDDFAATDMNSAVSGNFLNNDYDPNVDDALTFNGLLLDPNGPVSPVDTASTEQGGQVIFFSDGSYTYTPPSGYSGTDAVVYGVCDTALSIQCAYATIHFLVAPISRDYSDLPASWGIRYTRYLSGSTVAGSSTLGYWLGAGISADDTAMSNSDASGDASDDGLIYPTLLDSTKGNLHQVIVNANQSGIKVYYRLYVDWDQNGTFDSAYSGHGITGSPDTVDLFLYTPAGFGGGKVNYRLVAQTDSNSLDNPVTGGGEIEDYQFPFSSPVPVELLQFSGSYENGDPHLEWATAREINSAYFLLERSLDAEEFERVAEIPAAGTSDRISSYSHNDLAAPIHDLLYYRLQQVDRDGSIAYSKIIALQRQENVRLVVYPNPTAGLLQILWSGTSKAGDITYALIDAYGVTQTSGTLNAQSSISLRGLAKGLYLLEVSQNGQRRTVYIQHH